MAESLESDTLKGTTCVSCAFSNFTISSIAPTLFGRKTENCRTSGPPIFEVVSGKSTGIGMGRRRGKFDAARPTEYLIVDLFFANQYWRCRRRPRAAAGALWRAGGWATQRVSDGRARRAARAP